MVHVVQACNEEKGLIEDEFIAVRQGLELVELQIFTEKVRIEGEVSGVGGYVVIQQAMNNEIRQGITMLQTQDNVSIKAAGDIFEGIHKQIHNSLKKKTENGSTLLNHRRSIMRMQEDVWKIQISNITLSSMVEAIDKFVQTLPTKQDLSEHTKAMDEALAKIHEVSTGFTVHLEEYKMSGNTTHAPRSIQAGPSYTHLNRRPQAEEYYEYESSLSTQDDAIQYYRLTGGNGNESEEKILTFLRIIHSHRIPLRQIHLGRVHLPQDHLHQDHLCQDHLRPVHLRRDHQRHHLQGLQDGESEALKLSQSSVKTHILPKESPGMISMLGALSSKHLSKIKPKSLTILEEQFIG